MSSTLRKSDPSEIQVRNGQDHTRVYDPELYKRLGDILEVLEKMQVHLAIITGEDNL